MPPKRPHLFTHNIFAETVCTLHFCLYLIDIQEVKQCIQHQIMYALRLHAYQQAEDLSTPSV